MSPGFFVRPLNTADCMGLLARISRMLFCAAAGVTAAALVDPLIETLSNAGAFGRGNFTDHSTIDVLPTLGAGSVLALAFVAIAAWRIYKPRAFAPEWLRASASMCAPRSLPALIPIVVAIQFAALFTMESIEQIVTLGHPLGGAVWLGGPAIIALLLHAVGAIVVTVLFSQLLHHAAQTLVDALRALRSIQVPRETSSCARVRLQNDPAVFRLSPCVERLKGRAPPLLPVLE